MSTYIPEITRETAENLTTRAVVSYNSAKVEVHRAVVADLVQVAKHGDCSQLKRLVNGLGYGKLVMKKYIETFSPVKFNKLKNDDFNLTCKGWADFQWDFTAIMAGIENPSKRWDNIAKESEPKPYGVEDLLKMIERVANDEGKGKRKIAPEAKKAASIALAAIKAA